MVFLEGSVTLTDGEGKEHRFQAGDVALVPKGIRYRWKDDHVKKYWVIVEPERRVSSAFCVVPCEGARTQKAMKSALAPMLLACNLGTGFLGPDGKVLPFDGPEEIEGFLREAEVISRTEIRGSRNRPVKLLLRGRGVEAHAVFRTADKKKASARVGKETIRDFHDSYVYECAAYELSRLLGLDSVPPCVLRTIDGVAGSLQLWIEQAVTEFQDRQDSGRAPLAERLPEAVQRMYLFDALIDNFDRHAGNVLLDARDRMWLVDHTRSFRLYTDATGLDPVVSPDPALLDRLAALDRATLSRHLGPFVTTQHIDALTRRRRQILRHFGLE